MRDQLERYTADQLLLPATQTTILHQELERTEVHWHDYYELGHVLQGTAEHVVNGVAHKLAAGSTFLLTPANFHEIVPDADRPLTCYNVVIDPSPLNGQQLRELLPSPMTGRPGGSRTTARPRRTSAGCGWSRSSSGPAAPR